SLEGIVMDAIKYNLVAIGEAASHIRPELQAEHPDIDWPAIRGLRNILTHEYFRVDSQRVREIAETHVPDLLRRVADILTRD
ncbi:MAG TPA: HepT-like ribonuclease domain-containing protein, partial [Acidimicrobiia bacterium]|nr:HepT-like ribonuclease domain-containing protein [Acidimicrobiia bacterium]